MICIPFKNKFPLEEVNKLLLKIIEENKELVAKTVLFTSASYELYELLARILLAKIFDVCNPPVVLTTPTLNIPVDIVIAER